MLLGFIVSCVSAGVPWGSREPKGRRQSRPSVLEAGRPVAFSWEASAVGCTAQLRQWGLPMMAVHGTQSNMQPEGQWYPIGAAKPGSAAACGRNKPTPRKRGRMLGSDQV